MSTRESLNILQLTDSHLFADEQGRLLGMDTRRSLDVVVAHVLRSGFQPDLVLATGDIAQEVSTEAYQYFLDKIACFQCPVSWLPGNHDDPALMERVFRKPYTTIFERGRWLVLCLNSSLEGQVFGHLSDREYKSLTRQLALDPDKHVLIAVHHHPFNVGSLWLDDIGLKKGERLLALLKQFPQVKVLLTGHVHQVFEREINGLLCLSTPSTCIQFTPGADNFTVDEAMPGYRTLSLAEDGSVQTRVQRVPAYDSGLDLSSQGY